jgi:hypothetical protein
MAFAEYFNLVHPTDGAENGVFKALTQNNISMSKDSVEKIDDPQTTEDWMDGVFRCLSICLLLGELEFEETKKGC